MGQTMGLNAEWIRKLRRIMAALEAAGRPEQMNYPGSHFHPLKGGQSGPLHGSSDGQCASHLRMGS